MGESKKRYLLEHVFRHEYGKIVSFLVHKFGPSHLESIEDAVQESLIKAMQVWAYDAPPNNPTSWLLRVANNSLLDSLRRNRKMVKTHDVSFLDLRQTAQEEVNLNHTINDSQLKMVFACCHPSLSQEYQIILSLKLIGGFGNKEIAKALLKKEETIAKSFTRAKKRMKENVRTLDSPLEIGLKSRLTIVLRIIYLLFTEGYAASSGEVLIKKDICIEAIRLALLLTMNKSCDRPEVHALIALMCLHASRFEARTDQNGEMVDLENQDRSVYDKELVKVGIQHLEKASVDAQPSNYHLQAAVSYYHSTAKSFLDTDWKSILQLYDLQLQRQYSPIVQLNSIVPFYKVYGAIKAIGKLKAFEQSPYFIDNALYYAIKAELELKIGNIKASKVALKKAIDRSQNEMEKNHFIKKLNTYE